MKYPASTLLPAAVKDLAVHCSKVNGFTGDGKEFAVRILLVLERHSDGGYRFDDLVALVLEAGWSEKQARQLREMAVHVSQGRSFRPPIDLNAAQSERIAQAYAQTPA